MQKNSTLRVRSSVDAFYDKDFVGVGLAIRADILVFRTPLAIDNRCVPDRPDFDGRRVGNFFMAIAACGCWPDQSQVSRFDVPGVFAGHGR